MKIPSFHPEYKRYNRTVRIFYWSLAAIIFAPQFAFASGDIVTTVVYNICDWLSGSLAVAMGVLACIGIGYTFMTGHIHKAQLLCTLIGLGLIIGGSYFAKSILLSGIY